MARVNLDIIDPDRFLVRLFRMAPGEVVAVLTEQAAALERPPMSLSDSLGSLSRAVPRFAAAVNEYLEMRSGEVRYPE